MYRILMCTEHRMIFKALIFLSGGILAFSLPAHAANRLIDSSSPYLLQHAHNPVNWYPWGEEAFARARAENKPVLLSIGYSTCYWCHVMEREIFENPEIAKLMNQSIVSVKVDREQRPDLDEIYMTATQLMTGRGGWPNNVFVTPDRKPFYAATYFPPDAFTSLIQGIREAWTQNRATVEADAGRMAGAIIRIQQRENQAAGALPGRQAIDVLIDYYGQYYDNRLGGFYQAPKFPYEDALLFLLDAYRLIGNQAALTMVRGTVEKMAEGGIHDQVGGGFHRYSTDGEWRIPHFEGMLYNQALLGRAYSTLYALTQSPADRAVAEGVFDFTLREMTHEKDGFHSALDAETRAVEGACYVWTDAQLRDALDKESYAWLTKCYGLAEIPEIAGHKYTVGGVLYGKQPLGAIAEAEGLSVQDAARKRQTVMTALRKVRDRRELPHLDDKIISAWNGLMIDAFARRPDPGKTGIREGRIPRRRFHADQPAEKGRHAVSHLAGRQGGNRRLFRGYAFLVQGLASTYLATEQDRYLAAAKELAAQSGKLFRDEEHGGYCFTDGNEWLLVRMKNAEGSATPSGKARASPAYPGGRALSTPLGDIRGYEGKVVIPMRVTDAGRLETPHLLVDSSIVVIENIEKHLKQGKAPQAAAYEGAKEVALPVLVTTITVFIGFLPNVVLTGISKYLFTPLAIVVSLAMIGSYFFSMTLVPIMAAALFKHETAGTNNGHEERPKTLTF